MGEWVKLEDFNFEDEKLLCFHVDTRDFHVVGNYEKPDMVLSESKQYVVDLEKVKQKLFEWRESSGGSEKDWRHFDLKDTPYSNSWNFKYLRFFKGNVGWLFMKDEKTLPPEYLDKKGVDYLDEYRKNRPVAEKVLEEGLKSFETYEYKAQESYMIYNNRPGFHDDYPKPPQYVRGTPKIQNNEPCSCGSGKKFKECCKN